MPHELTPVEEEPDDVQARIAEPFLGDGSAPRPKTAEDYLAEGNEAYTRAGALEGLHGLNADTVAEYRKAGQALISIAAVTPLGEESRDIEQPDPIRLMKIADCLAKQALATDISPYEGNEYQQGGRWERIPEQSPDGTWVSLSHHEYLQKLSRRYLLRASGIFMDEGHAALASELTAENPAEVIPEAAVEAAIDVDDTQEYIPPFVRAQQKANHEPQMDANQVERFISTHAKQPDTGAEFIARMSEIALEELTEPNQLAAA